MMQTHFSTDNSRANCVKRRKIITEQRITSKMGGSKIKLFFKLGKNLEFHNFCCRIFATSPESLMI